MVQLEGPKWAHLVPLLLTLATLLATCGIHLRIFMHFWGFGEQLCIFFKKIRGNPRKIKQIALKIMNIAQKHRKSC